MKLRRGKPSMVSKHPVERVNLQKYNRNPEQCRWAITPFGDKIKDCNFRYINPREVTIKTGDITEIVVVVTLPVGTKLYHGTGHIPGRTKWWEQGYPGGGLLAWFTSTPEHQGVFRGRTHILEYITNTPLIMAFFQNIDRFERGIRGFEFIPTFIHIARKLELTGIIINGYIGCNECEIGIISTDVPKHLDLPPIVVKEIDYAYFD